MPNRSVWRSADLKLHALRLVRLLTIRGPRVMLSIFSKIFSGRLALHIEVRSPQASFSCPQGPSGSKSCGILGNNSVDDTKGAVLSFPQVFVLIRCDGASQRGLLQRLLPD